MNFFDLLGAAGAGAMRGEVQGEQYKQQKSDKKSADSYRQGQLSLMLRKQIFEEEQAKGQEVGKLREMAVKSLFDLETKMATDQNWATGLSPEQKERFNSHRSTLRYLASNPSATTADYIEAFSQVPEKYGNVGQMGTQQPEAQPPNLVKQPLNFDSNYNTTLTSEEEKAFQLWKMENAPNDSGEDYDLRGAFKAGLTPDIQSGHWPDTYKKPNHTTFSNESQYAPYGKPGRWQGETFVPPFTLAQQPGIEPGLFPGMGGGLPTEGGLQRGDVSPEVPGPPRLNRPQAAQATPPSLAPKPPSTYEEFLTAGFSPDYAADQVKKQQAGAASQATARYNTARATNEEARSPYVVPGERAGIENKQADTGLKKQQTKILGGRLDLDKKKVDDFNAHWDATFNASRTDANRDFQLRTRMTDISQYAAETRDALAQAEMGLIQIRGKELQQKIEDMEKLDPYFRGLIQALPAMVQTDLYGDKAISPEVAGMVRGALEKAGSKYAEIMGQSQATPGTQPAPSSPGMAPPTQQGNVPMLPNPQTGTVTPPALVAVPHGVRLQGQGPENNRAFADQLTNNAARNPGNPTRPRKGKPNTRQPAKASPKAPQSSKPRAVRSMSTEELQRELFSGKKGK